MAIIPSHSHKNNITTAINGFGHSHIASPRQWRERGGGESDLNRDILIHINNNFLASATKAMK